MLYNVEKSNRYAETVIGESDFDSFQAVKEGQGAENDEIEQTYKKTIEHISFMKEFTITAEMAEDSMVGIASKMTMGTNMKNKPRKFVRAYYKTRNKLAQWALINGTETTGVFNKARVDLTTADGLSLFNNAHTYAKEKFSGQTQSNYFYGDVLNSGAAGSRAASASVFESFLNKANNKIRNFKDEDGEIMEYTADICIIPSNRPTLEQIAKKVIGSERAAGTDHNDINLQYGNWTLVVMPQWQATDDRVIIMSSEANKNILGNMFYNRKPLDIQNWIDGHTRNFIWNGRTRMGIGFTNWRHIAMFVDGASAVTGATSLG